MEKEAVYIYTMEYYSFRKRNAFDSVLMRWMNLEHIIQSEVIQKEKNKHCILMYIYGIYTATMEDSMEIPLKTRNKTTI